MCFEPKVKPIIILSLDGAVCLLWLSTNVITYLNWNLLSTTRDWCFGPTYSSSDSTVVIVKVWPKFWTFINKWPPRINVARVRTCFVPVATTTSQQPKCHPIRSHPTVMWSMPYETLLTHPVVIDDYLITTPKSLPQKVLLLLRPNHPSHPHPVLYLITSPTPNHLISPQSHHNHLVPTCLIIHHPNTNSHLAPVIWCLRSFACIYSCYHPVPQVFFFLLFSNHIISSIDSLAFIRNFEKSQKLSILWDLILKCVNQK